MAQNGLVKLFICRSCRHSLQKLRKQSRTFTHTAPRAKTIPSFTPTSSPELDELLLTYRTKVFTPYALQQYHRDLIYKPSRHQILLNDPGVTVTLSNDEEVKLMPMDPHDKPNKVKSLRKLAELLENSSEGKDWNNIPAFLEGMVMAKEQLPKGWLQKVVRKANENHKTGVIVRCAEMVKKTGVTLAEPPVTEELMLGFHIRAVHSGWESEDAEKATKQVEQVALMMEDKDHCGGKLKEGHEDMRRNITVVGVLLELAAAKAVHKNGGQDVDGKVARYTRNAVLLCELETFQVGQDYVDGAKKLERWIPLRNGLKLASRIPSIGKGDLAGRLREQVKRLDSAVNEAKGQVEEQAGGKPRRCLNMLKELNPS